jgi:hypothetical protein
METEEAVRKRRDSRIGVCSNNIWIDEALPSAATGSGEGAELCLVHHGQGNVRRGGTRSIVPPAGGSGCAGEALRASEALDRDEDLGQRDVPGAGTASETRKRNSNGKDECPLEERRVQQAGTTTTER